MLLPRSFGFVRSFGCGVLLACLLVNALDAQTGGSALTVLRTFNRTTDGSNSRSTGRLIQATNAAIYGIHPVGGSANGGTLFRFGLDGVGFVVLKHFSATDGGSPVVLFQSRDGLLYGVCHATGTTPQASLFRVALDGNGFTVLRRFVNGTDAWLPDNMIEGTDGLFYGAAKAVSSLSYAHVLFRVARDGSGFTVLRTLTYEVDGNDETSLIQGPDGRLYGSALDGGGSTYMGTVFALNPDGSGFTVLKRFQGTEGRRPNRLAFHDGQIYGTTRQGGPTADWGVMFRMRPDGSGYTVLHEFRGTFPPAAGEFPLAGVTVRPNGNLYGVTAFGGTLSANGTLFRYDAVAGKMYFLNQFFGEAGVEPGTELLAATDGKLYGFTSGGGTMAGGALFSYDLTRLGADVGLVGAVGQPFSYQHTFGNTATGLPAGLTMGGTQNLITGTPTQAGVFQVTISGPIGFSTGSNMVTVTIAKGETQVLLSNLTQSADGTPKRPTVTTVPAGLPVTLLFPGLSTPPSLPGSYAVTAIVNETNYSGIAQGTLVIGATAPRFTAPVANVATVAGAAVTLRAEVSVSLPATYIWQRKARGQDVFVDLVEGAGFTGVSTNTLSIQGATTAMNGDQFRLVVTNGAGTATGEPATLVVRPSCVLTNVSVRARVVPGENLTVGMVTSGRQSLLLRGVGPGLAPFIGRDAAGDPVLRMANAANPRLAENDNWGGEAGLAAAFTQVGAFPLPLDSQDAVVLTPIDGAATARVSVAAAGLVLVEAYDAASERTERLVNLSALHLVGADADALVAGFNLSGTGTTQLLIRGVGPGLRDFGVTNAIADPALQVFREGTQIAANDDWLNPLASTAAAVGAFPLAAGSKDAALLLTLAPGAYTIRLSNVQAGTGAGLIEIYEVR